MEHENVEKNPKEKPFKKPKTRAKKKQNLKKAPKARHMANRAFVN